jgi:hypothetical protein
MAAGIDVVFDTNITITYNGTTATHTLPFKLWPSATEPNQLQPFIPTRAVWTSKGATASDEVIIQNSQGTDWLHLVADGTNFMQPLPLKTGRGEPGPVQAIITKFDSGELILYW